MNKLIYYVATSLDGFISGINGDISMFPFHEAAIAKYKTDLQDFSTVIMGRKTYELGYQYGLEPGQPAYDHMEHFIFSETLKIKNLAKTVHIEKLEIQRVKEIIASAPSDVYLCGGGQFAGWLLDHGMIGQLKIKLNPIVIGEGVPIFGASKTAAVTELIHKESFEGGIQFLTYNLMYE